MKKIITLFILLALLVACTPGATPASVERLPLLNEECETIYTFEIGDELKLCKEGEQSTATEQATETPSETSAPSDTVTPSQTALSTVTPSRTSTLTPTRTPGKVTATKTSTPTAQAPTVTPSAPGVTPTVVVTPTQPPTGGIIHPFRAAAACPDNGLQHDTSKWHGPWDYDRGCHYDHEHGSYPFTPELASAFPGFDLRALQGGVEVGHTNPSSPMENTHKHGGFKWDFSYDAPQSCDVGFEDGTIAIDAYAIQYHSFGMQSIEFEAHNHSASALLRQCKEGNPSDKGYVFVITLQEYGQRVMPYQGMVLPYPDNFQPEFSSPRGQYFTTECFGNDFTIDNGHGGLTLIDCRNPGDVTNNNLSIWTSKITGLGPRPQGSSTFTLLFRSRDVYERIDPTDMIHPFTWRFVCGNEVYVPAGCRHNNTTGTIHEVMGEIPAAWDNLAGVDSDPRVGRITAQGFIDRFGTPMTALECSVAGGNCYPIKLVNAFVGKYSSELSVVKVSNPTPQDTPERDIYFCRDEVCTETDPGATPAGWIGANN